jgi:hypothetical protein
MECIFELSNVQSTSVGDAPLVQQQRMDNPPSIVSSRPEIQKRRPLVLKLAKKFQRFFCSWRRWVNRLSLEPTFPFQEKKGFSFVLSH